MRIQLGDKVAVGGHADLYRATDELQRQLAVKIVRASAAASSSAIDHARALARVKHPSVVVVYSIETVTDPESGESVDAVVMEWIDGQTLASRLRKNRFSTHEVHRIGTGLLDGIEQIHLSNLTHDDLHAENVILSNAGPKIIDILYRDTLALLSRASREARVHRDLTNLRQMLYEILLCSELDAAMAAEFQVQAPRDASLNDLRIAFNHAASRTRQLGETHDDRSRQSIRAVRDLTQFAMDTLLYADLGPNQTTWSLDSWHDRVERWKDETKRALRDLGCADQEIVHFQTLGEFKRRKFPGINDDHVNWRERLAERIERAETIITRYERLRGSETVRDARAVSFSQVRIQRALAGNVVLPEASMCREAQTRRVN